MKITRFVNGKRLASELSKEFVIENEVISNTIERVNNRIKRVASYRKDDANE